MSCIAKKNGLQNPIILSNTVMAVTDCHHYYSAINCQPTNRQAMTYETVPPTKLKLADHFPLVSKKCEKQASAFFECFYTKGEQPPEGVSKQQCTDK